MVDESLDVVIATRGQRAAMLEEALQSIMMQTWQGSIVVTVVYDCDELPAQAVHERALGTRIVRLVLNNDEHGLAFARNRGVAAGHAPWVAFLDDDDLWKPDKLSEQFALLRRRPEFRLVGTGIDVLDVSGVSTARPALAESVDHLDLLRDRITELHPSSFLLRRETFDAVGGVDTSLPGAYAEDYDLLLKVSATGPIGMVLDPLTTVRWTGQSYFTSQWETVATALRVLLANHPDFTRSPKGLARIKGQIAFAESARGERLSGLRAAASAARHNPLEPRAHLAVLVALGLAKPEFIQARLHERGRGI